MGLKNKEVLQQIEQMLQDVKQADPQLHDLMLALLGEVFMEYNTAKNCSVEQKLYKLIDIEARKQVGTGVGG